MSIKARLIITISLAIAIAFALIGVVTVTATERRMISRLDASLRAAPLWSPQTLDNNPRADRIDTSRRATAIVFMNANGNLRLAEPAGYADNPEPLPDLTLEDLASHAGGIYTTGAEDGSSLRYRVLVRRFQGGYLAQAAPLDDVEATIAALIRIIGLAAVAVLVIVTLAVWLSVRRGLRPIDDMIGTAGLIADGNLSHRVEHASSATEVGRLGQALNTMLGKIETSFDAKEASEQRLRQFVADASHELRTPLTSIRGYAELFRNGAATDPETLERVMLRIESEGARMSALIEDLLLLARLDQGRPLDRRSVDLVPLVSDLVADARVIDPDRSITLDHPATANVLGDADRLRQVVGNLLTNARVHTAPATPVHVTIDTDATTVRVSVSDDGPGIPPAEAARVFDRFYRADTSRARASGGTGLGLSIVASLTEAHGGHVHLESTPGHGTTVTIALPRLIDAESRHQPAPSENADAVSFPDD